MRGNQLLDALSRADAARVTASAVQSHGSLRQTLFDRGDDAASVWLPLVGTVISIVQVLDDGSVVEAGVVGDEGLVGIEYLFGRGRRVARAVVQNAGGMLKLGAGARDEFRRAQTFHDGVLLFASCLIEQIAQTAACNRRHDLSQRLARWLLGVSERTHVPEVRVTHEMLAAMLGTRRRAGITVAMAQLAARRVVTIGRGVIRIEDRAALEEAACECYATTRPLR
jgi:CRP-like cAMP-binding protein